MTAVSARRQSRRVSQPPARRCAWRPCGRRFVPAGRGRPPVYCCGACRAAAYRERGGPKQRRLVDLTEADARAVLPRLPGGSVDLILTDPPYLFDRGGTYFRRWFAELADEEWPAVFSKLYRVLARDRAAYVFCDARVKPVFDVAAAAAGFAVRAPLIWDKLSIGLGGAWRSQYEFIARYEKGRPAWSMNDWANIRGHPRVRGYPTEKPVALLRELVIQSTAPGWTVLDPFCGSGNTGRAARQLGRRALLLDVDASAAQRRLRVAAIRDATAR